ncbi:MAG: UbiA family prenyltransferase [Fibrobacter sp.]|nr:UbiA family prenyltransferase [Fibrobacter sp.]
MISTILKMIRPVNIVIAVVTLVVGYFLLGEISFGSENDTSISITTLILQSLGFAFAIGFGNIQNDVLDFESDKKNRPDRPLPSGSISLVTAKRVWIALLILSIGCGIADTIVCASGPWLEGIGALASTLFFIALALLLVAYNKKLKHVPLLKNMTVAFLCMTPLILALFYPTVLRESDVDGLDIPTKLGFLYPAMMFAFLLTTAREIYKDLEDETGDLMAGIITFPIAAGAPTARRLAGVIVGFTWLLLPLPVMQGYYPPLFIGLTLVILTPTFIYIVLQAKKQNYRKAQSITKLSMFAGLVALIVSIIL